MCRIFLLWKKTSAISTTEIVSMLEHSKQRDSHSTHYTDKVAKDGYGLAGYSTQTHRWNVYKSPDTYETDPHFSRVLDKFTTYSFVIGHMRKCPKWSSVKVENNHPFYYKNHVFLQHGSIRGLETPLRRTFVIKDILPEFIPNIQGTTDTELLFYLFLTKYRESALISPSSSGIFPHTLREIYQHHREHYTELCILYTAIVSTLEYLHRHFPKITTNLIYSNKQYTMVLRHRFEKHIKGKSTTSNTLYWNNPPNNQSSDIIITTCREGSSNKLIPDNTLLFIENNNGKTFVVDL